jgi:hypothetical protein
MPDATFAREAQTAQVTVENAANANELREGPAGRAEYLQGSSAAIAGQNYNYKDIDKIVITKPTGMSFLNGGRVWWDRTNRRAHFKRSGNRDSYLGTSVGDAAADATSMTVDLNKQPYYHIDLLNPDWTKANTDGLGVTELRGGAVQLAFDAVAEVAMASIIGTIPFDVAGNPILEGKIIIVDNGDNAALDVDFGLASGSHGADFETIAEFVAFHIDGNTLDIKAHSDDTATDVTIVDTTLNFVEGTAFEFWIDCRDRDNCKLYVDGVRVLPSTAFKLTAATGPLFPICLMEKTSDDTPADVRLVECRVRTSEQ